jgi:hypothetical protein
LILDAASAASLRTWSWCFSSITASFKRPGCKNVLSSIYMVQKSNGQCKTDSTRHLPVRISHYCLCRLQDDYGWTLNHREPPWSQPRLI